MSLAALIAAQRVEGGIPHAVSCRAVGVSQAWFYKWRRGDPSLRRKRRAALASVIAYLFKAHHGTYGSPRITADLGGDGLACVAQHGREGDGRAGPHRPSHAAAPVLDQAGPLRAQGAGRVACS